MASVIANAETYSDLGCSQQCEHANREVTFREPKSHHYGESESLDFRVKATAACTVLMKGETTFVSIIIGAHGVTAVMRSNSMAGISPGEYTKKYAIKRMKERTNEMNKSSLPSTKRRRLILKQERATTQASLEVGEGVSYQSGVALESSADIEKIPDAVPRANFQSLSIPHDSVTVVSMDLETTDLIRGQQMPHITQIAAVSVHTPDVFNIYVKPKEPISLGAQQTTGIVYSSTSGIMTVRGVEVTPVDIITALDKFCSWLKQFKNVILLAHNGRKFDFPVLVSAFEYCNSTEKLLESVNGCVDSLAFFK